MDDESRRIGENLTRFGYLDAEKLKQATDRVEERQLQGRPMTLVEVVLQLQLAPIEQVARAIAHQSTAVLRCQGCKRRFTVPDFQANRKYRCAPCKAYLEIVVEEQIKPREQEPAAGPVEIVPRKDKFAGKIFGNYRLTRRLAKGGMGLVYLGEDVQTRDQVAVKILTEEFSHMPAIKQRFEREGTAGGRLEHPNIVEVLDTGLQDEYTYVVTRYVDGPSLEQVIAKEKQLPLEKAVALTCDILSGLQHAHERGVVHRDIKPANILTTSEGRAKLIDFGLAMDAEANTILTMTGNVMGTPTYMSPEQARGERGGAASDQYACGIILFQLLTGRKPYESKSIVALLEMQVNQPLPSIRATHPEVPEAIDRIARKMTAKKSEERYPSPAEAADALQRAIHPSADMTTPAPLEAAVAAPAPIPVAPPPRPLPHRRHSSRVQVASGNGAAWLWALAAVAIVAAGVVLILALR